MDINNLINLFRARLFNIKLFGNLRIGLYREISIGELLFGPDGTIINKAQCQH